MDQVLGPGAMEVTLRYPDQIPEVNLSARFYLEFLWVRSEGVLHCVYEQSYTPTIMEVVRSS